MTNEELADALDRIHVPVSRKAGNAAKEAARRLRGQGERIEGWMKRGPQWDQGSWRGWKIHADEGDDMLPVTILVPKGFIHPQEPKP